MNARPKKNRSSSARGGRGKGLERQISVDGVYNNHRFMQALGTIVGMPVQIQTNTKETFEGVLSTFSPEFHVVVDWPHPVMPGSNSIANPDTIKRKIIFPSKDIVLVKVLGVDFDYAARDSFAVDSAISNRYNGQSAKEKALTPWVDGDAPNSSFTPLDDENANGWNADDMFKENEERYGVKSTYSSGMEEYTTPLPNRNSKEYKEQEALAQKLASEIEHSPIAQARAEFENGDDEEAKFSAVKRPEAPSSGHGPPSLKYVLPQRRNKITGAPTNKPPPRGTPSPQSNVGGSIMHVPPTTRHSHSSSPIPPSSSSSSTSIPSASTPSGGSVCVSATPPQQKLAPHSLPSGLSSSVPDSNINGDAKDARRLEGTQLPMRERENPHHKESYHSDYSYNQHHSTSYQQQQQHSQSSFHHSSQYHNAEARRSEPKEQRERKYRPYKDDQIADFKKFGKDLNIIDNTDKKTSSQTGPVQTYHQQNQPHHHNHPTSASTSHHQVPHSSSGGSLQHSSNQGSQSHHYSNQVPPPPQQSNPNAHQSNQSVPSSAVPPVGGPPPQQPSQGHKSISQTPHSMHPTMIQSKHHQTSQPQSTQSSSSQSMQQLNQQTPPQLSQHPTSHHSGAISHQQSQAQVHSKPSKQIHSHSHVPPGPPSQGPQTGQNISNQSHSPTQHATHSHVPKQQHPLQHTPHNSQPLQHTPSQPPPQQHFQTTSQLQQHTPQPPQTSQYSQQPPELQHSCRPMQQHSSQFSQPQPSLVQSTPTTKPVQATPSSVESPTSSSSGSTCTTISSSTTTQPSTSQTSVTSTVECKVTTPDDNIGSIVSNSILNPKAKEFIFNPDAEPFTPRSPSTMTPPRPQTPLITPTQAPPIAATGPPPVGFQQSMVQTYVIPTQPFPVQSQQRPFQKRVPVAPQRPEYASPVQVAAATGHPLLAPTPQPLTTVQLTQNMMHQTGNPYQYPMKILLPSPFPMTQMMVPTSLGMYHQGDGQQNNLSHNHQAMYMAAGGLPHHQPHHVTTPGPHPPQPPTPQGHNNHGPAPPNMPAQPPTPGPTPPQQLMYGNPGGAPMGAQPTIPQHMAQPAPHAAQSPHNHQYAGHNPASHHPHIVMLPHIPPHMMPPGGPPHSGAPGTGVTGHPSSSMSGYTPTSSGVVQHLSQPHHLHYIPANPGNQAPHLPLVHHNQ